MYHLVDLCLKMVDPVLEVIWSDHPDSCSQLFASLYFYHGLLLEIVHLDLMLDTVNVMVQIISSG